MKNQVLIFLAAVCANTLNERILRSALTIFKIFHCDRDRLSLTVVFSERLEAYQNATGLTDDQIDIIRQKSSSLRNIGGISIAQYSYDNGDLKGLEPVVIWNNEIINTGIGIGFNFKGT